MTDDVVQTAINDAVRVFADASAIVPAAIADEGPSARLFDAARRGEIVLYASLYARDEAERILRRKKPQALGAFWDLRGTLLVVDAADDLVAEVARVIEPKNAAIVAGAITAQADFLVTYDRRHILRQAALIWQLHRIETLFPGVMLDLLGGQS